MQGSIFKAPRKLLFLYHPFIQPVHIILKRITCFDQKIVIPLIIHHELLDHPVEPFLGWNEAALLNLHHAFGVQEVFQPSHLFTITFSFIIGKYPSAVV